MDGNLVVKYIFSLLLVLGLVSCGGDSRMTNMVDDSIYIKDAQLNKIEFRSEGDYHYKLVVIKSGIGQQSADVMLSINENLLQEYNKLNKTDYEMLPETCYTVINNRIYFPKSGYQDAFEIIFDSSQIKELQDGNERAFALPCKLSLLNTSIVVSSEDKLYSIIVPQAIDTFLESENRAIIKKRKTI